MTDAPKMIWVDDVDGYSSTAKMGAFTTPYIRADAPELVALREASFCLRQSQRAYMTDRGNNVLGALVGKAAADLDTALAAFDALTARTGEPE